VVLASAGYPENPQVGVALSSLPDLPPITISFKQALANINNNYLQAQAVFSPSPHKENRLKKQENPSTKPSKKSNSKENTIVAISD
jgi:hypothetical protein